MTWISSSPVVVQVIDVTKTFGDTRVLDELSFRVEPGTTVAVVGPNGSGKSTLLRILAGVLLPDTGSALVGEQPPGNGLATFVPAGDRMLDWRLTGAQNLAFFARARRGAHPDWRVMADLAAEKLSAAHLLSKRAGECSTGQRRRLMLCAAFAGLAPLVLLDEPFEDLDEEGQDALTRACAEWAEGGGTILFASPGLAGAPPTDVIIDLRTDRDVGEA